MIETSCYQIAQRFVGLAEVPGIADTVLELEVTPNRGDWLSILGVAREVAAVTGVRLKHPRPRPRESGVRATRDVRVRVETPDLCPRYTVRLVRGVSIGPSPFWLRLRLRRAGMRSVNQVVDATNYVMIERGQPLHAFDFAHLAGDFQLDGGAPGTGFAEATVGFDHPRRALAGQPQRHGQFDFPFLAAGIAARLVVKIAE